MNSDDPRTDKASSDGPPRKLVARTACGGEVDNPGELPSAIYRGERVYFCMRACLRVFQQDPDAFMAGEIEHPSIEAAE
jgi:YHS domain-containing protein